MMPIVHIQNQYEHIIKMNVCSRKIPKEKKNTENSLLESLYTLQLTVTYITISN